MELDSEAKVVVFLPGNERGSDFDPIPWQWFGDPLPVRVGTRPRWSASE
jgi:hypothetical protein